MAVNEVYEHPSPALLFFRFVRSALKIQRKDLR
jgi:hypothetical protein